MAWFDGFPFRSKEDRERSVKEFEKRVVPFGAEKQREKLQATLRELYPKADIKDVMFVFFDAKDAYMKKESKAEGLEAAKLRLKKVRWLDERGKATLIRFVELESGIDSLDDYPTAADVLSGLSEDYCFTD
ncbi:MAG: hypothetical protein FWF33_07315 [Clostridiales bacterium]|nr:hypothetical protein [Clostridiales bacterium]